MIPTDLRPFCDDSILLTPKDDGTWCVDLCDNNAAINGGTNKRFPTRSEAAAEGERLLIARLKEREREERGEEPDDTIYPSLCLHGCHPQKG